MAPDTLTRPLHLWVPEYESTNGDIAAEVGEQVGLPPDGEQRMILDAIYAEKAPGIPACFEVAVIGPRQNLKTAGLQISALTDLFVFEEELVVWTAHLFKTAQAAFEGMVRLIEGNDDFRKRCRKPRTANGDEAIELLTGQRIEFHARSKGGGRGLTGSKVILDEGLFLAPGEMGALLPTMATRPAAQVRYGSSAGLVSSDVLRAVRNRGRKGGDPSLAYFEWGAPETKCATSDCTHEVGSKGCALDNRALWRQANPAFGRRISEDILAQFRRAMPPMEFAREFLSWWDDPATAGGAGIAADDWAKCLDRKSGFAPGSPVALGVDVTPDKSRANIAGAGGREDGLPHVELLEEVRPSKAVETILALQQKRRAPVAIDPGSKAGFLIQPLEDAGVEVIEVSLQKHAQACGAILNAATEGYLRHIGQAQLDAAVASARLREVSRGAEVWRPDGTASISPLIAATHALHGYATTAGKQADSVYEDRGMVTL